MVRECKILRRGFDLTVGQGMFCDDLDYMRVGDECVVTCMGNHKRSDLIIPSMYNGHPVTALVRVVIPDSVTEIGNYVFCGVASFIAVYYCGIADEWTWITVGTNETITSDALYCCSESTPSEDGKFWHYVDGESVSWNRED